MRYYLTPEVQKALEKMEASYLNVETVCQLELFQHLEQDDALKGWENYHSDDFEEVRLLSGAKNRKEADLLLGDCETLADYRRRKALNDALLENFDVFCGALHLEKGAHDKERNDVKHILERRGKLMGEFIGRAKDKLREDICAASPFSEEKLTPEKLEAQAKERESSKEFRGKKAEMEDASSSHIKKYLTEEFEIGIPEWKTKKPEAVESGERIPSLFGAIADWLKDFADFLANAAAAIKENMEGTTKNRTEPDAQMLKEQAERFEEFARKKQQIEEDRKFAERAQKGELNVEDLLNQLDWEIQNGKQPPLPPSPFEDCELTVEQMDLEEKMHKEDRVPADGNCFYHSFIRNGELYGVGPETKDTWKEAAQLRKETLQWVTDPKNRKTVNEIIETANVFDPAKPDESPVSFESLCKTIGTMCSWGGRDGDVVPEIIARSKNQPVNILQYRKGYGDIKMQLSPEGVTGTKEISIYKCGQHYEVDKEYYNAYTEVYQDRKEEKVKEEKVLESAPPVKSK